MANQIQTPDNLLFNVFPDTAANGSIQPTNMRDFVLSTVGPAQSLNPNAATPPAVTQNFTGPSLPPFTSNALPYGVTLLNPSPAVLDLTFGFNTPGMTVSTRAQLASQVSYRDLFNETTQSANYINNFQIFPDYLPDGISPDPRNLHVIKSDHMSLVARTAMATDTNYSSMPFVSGYIRPALPFLPGMYAELCCNWPNNPNCWPTWWMFTGYQPTNSGNQYYAANGTALECDFFDGYSQDNNAYPVGTFIPCGTPLYAADSVYGNPDDTYQVGRGPYQTRYYGGQGASIAQIVTNAQSNPTNGYHVYAMDWRDPNTMVWIFDGHIVKMRRIKSPAVFNTTTGTTPSAAQLGQQLPMFLQVGHQFGPVLNTVNTAAVKAAQQAGTAMYYEYKLKWLRVWNSPSTAQPPSSTPFSVILPPAPYPGANVAATPTFADLPQITSATYVLDLDASASMPLSDQCGHNDVQLNGDCVWSQTSTINGLPTFTANVGGLSIAGPALFAAQGAGQFCLWLVMQNNAPTTSNVQIYAQFGRPTPQTNEFTDKMTLGTTALAPGGGVSNITSGGSAFSAYLSTSAQAFTGASVGTVTGNTPELVSMLKTIGTDGSVNLGQGFSQYHCTPDATGGVPVAQAANYANLTLGTRQPYYNDISSTNGFSKQICQAVMAYWPAGSALSANDQNSIETYLQNKWGVTNTHASGSVANTVVQQTGPAPGWTPGATAVTYSGHNFVWFNQANASFSGGGTSPLVLNAPALYPGISSRALVTAMTGSPATYTMALAFNLTTTQYYTFGMTLNTTGSNNFIASGYQANLPAQLKVSLWEAYNTENNDYYADYGNGGGVADNAVFYLRALYDGTNYTFLHSTTGAANSWTSLTEQTATTLGSPNYIGIWINPQDAGQTGATAVLTLSQYSVIASGSAQAAIGS